MTIENALVNFTLHTRLTKRFTSYLFIPLKICSRFSDREADSSIGSKSNEAPRSKLRGIRELKHSELP